VVLVDGAAEGATASGGAAGGSGAADAAGERLAVEWDWAVDERDVEFSVSFLPAAHVVSPVDEEVRAPTMHTAEAGPVEGRFEAQRGRTGVLRLRWSNRHAWAVDPRTKALSYKVSCSPTGAAVVPQEAQIGP